MKHAVIGDLCDHLAASRDVRRMGAILVEALERHWGGAALAWLPAAKTEVVLADEVVLSPQLLKTSTRDLLAAIREQRLDEWFVARGFAVTCIVDLPFGLPGQIGAAWSKDAPHAAAADIVHVLAAHVAELADRQRLEKRLDEAVAFRIEAERQIERTRRVRVLGEMASGIVHDFNNALTSILAHTELALGPIEQGQPYYDDLTHIRTAALDAAAVVRRLRHLGPNGRQPDEREVADLRDIARLVPSLARPRWLKASQCDGVSFEIVVEDGPVPPVYVAVAEIREVLLNLLFNAVDAMPGGGRITIATSTDANGWAVISVTDEGIGMSDETIGQLFRPFFSTKGDRGSGLGLSACHTIAVRHGARLDVQSVPGVGTTFTLGIPPAPELQTGAVPASTPALPYRPIASQRILLVDDQPEVRASIGDMLRASGHEVEAVESGEAAVAYGSMHRVDVLITDLGMPDMNGLEVARRFRVVAPAVPVILLTGWGLDADTEPPGNVAFVLTKPVTLKNLNDAVDRCKAEPVSARRTKCS